MKTLLFTLFLSLNSNAAIRHTCPKDSYLPKINSTKALDVSDLDILYMLINDDINIKLIFSLGKFTEYQKSVMREAVVRTKAALETPEFKLWIASFPFSPNWNRGNSNLKIYQNLIQGKEILSPYNVIDNEWDVFYSSYTSTYLQRNVLAYTSSDTKWIFFNLRNFSSNYETAVRTLAGNIAHEYMHKIGYSHSSNSTPERPFTVPYAIGN